MWRPSGWIGLTLLALSACGQPAQDAAAERRIEALVGPDGHLRAGSPLRIFGVGLSGCQLTLWSGGQQVAVAHWNGPVQNHEDGGVEVDAPEVVEARVGPSQAAVVAGSVTLDRACLQTISVGQQGGSSSSACRNINRPWRSAVSASAVSVAQTSVRFGERLTLQSDDVLLIGEGQVGLEVEVQAIDLGHRLVTKTIAVRHADWQRKSLSVAIDPDWLGPWPGARQIKVRLHQRVGQIKAVGSMSVLALTVLAPKWQAKTGWQDVRRGMVLPVVIESGVPGQGNQEQPGLWRLRIAGEWKSDVSEQQWPKEAARHAEGRGSASPYRAVLSSTAWYQGDWPKLVESGSGLRLSGQVAVEVMGAGHRWRDAWQPVQWQLRPTIQAVVVEMEDGFKLGLKHYGLLAHVDLIRARVLVLMSGHFEGLRVEIRTDTPPTLAEYIDIAVLDRDPNGGALLGADNSHGKDVGNRRLDEDLSGYSAATRMSGESAYGGVFLAGFEQFSKRLNPESSQGSVAFDSIFEPWMPALGGTPARADQGAAAAAAIEAMARLIAGSLSHEVGHALGLAAGSTDYHHAGDHPGWRMDAGPARPFSERAGLAGAGEETWGPVDEAYLKTILGKS